MYKNKIKKMVIISLLISLGLILHIVEGLIPMNAAVPGAKLGLANIPNLIAIVLFGFQAGFQVLILRVLLGSLLIGTFMTLNFYFSLAGGVIGFLAMAFAYYFFKNQLSLIGVSVIGAVFHNIGQILIAYLVIANQGIIYYLPYLLLMAVPTGIGVGLVSYFTLNHLPPGEEY